MSDKLEKDKIRQFLSNVVQKNYAEANKYLSDAVKHKMMSRIKQSTQKLGF